jgi:hypothetical protein
MEDLDYHHGDKNTHFKYGVCEVGMVIIEKRYANCARSGVLSVCRNPGNLKTDRLAMLALEMGPGLGRGEEQSTAFL